MAPRTGVDEPSAHGTARHDATTAVSDLTLHQGALRVLVHDASAAGHRGAVGRHEPHDIHGDLRAERPAVAELDGGIAQDDIDEHAESGDLSLPVRPRQPRAGGHGSRDRAVIIDPQPLEAEQLLGHARDHRHRRRVCRRRGARRHQ
ncbi:hypothetical protein [Nocardioides piscis]|uniref:Uncharacterized protein n=1 Tax=Nocardioides piscis TaxID=2714938 RepID=A0A6G7YHD9_9ACTN|nr:hypothetical protein [Nocardioides piscis]QIK76190.1 hypothetical protein G7071_12875 [Nocardioides piscis]